MTIDAKAIHRRIGGDPSQKQKRKHRGRKGRGAP